MIKSPVRINTAKQRDDGRHRSNRHIGQAMVGGEKGEVHKYIRRWEIMITTIIWQ